MTLLPITQCDGCNRPDTSTGEKIQLLACSNKHAYCKECVKELFQKSHPRGPKCPICVSRPPIDKIMILSRTTSDLRTSTSLETIGRSVSMLLPPTTSSSADQLQTMTKTHYSPTTPSSSTGAFSKSMSGYSLINFLELKAKMILNEEPGKQFTGDGFTSKELSQLREINFDLYNGVMERFFGQIKALLLEMPENMSSALGCASALKIGQQFLLIKLLNEQKIGDTEDRKRLLIENFLRENSIIGLYSETFSAFGYFETLRKCVENSKAQNPKTLYNLAYLYEFGLGVIKNVDIATAYYKSAKKLGHQKAAIKYALLLSYNDKKKKLSIKLLEEIIKNKETKDSDALLIKYRLGQLLIQTSKQSLKDRGHSLIQETVENLSLYS